MKKTKKLPLKKTTSVKTVLATDPIVLNNGLNADLNFDGLVAGTYSIDVYDGETLITTKSNIIVETDPLPTPDVVITDIVANDTTGAGNSDGSATANVNISDFTGQGTAVISPDPNTISPINLNDGDNALSFTDLPAGDYQVDVKDGDNIIDGFTFTIVDPTPPEGGISNITPTSPTTEGGVDGGITFDANITGCTGTATAVLNPTAGTTPITLTSGDNTGISFSPLPVGDYTVQIYCDDVLVDESDSIIVPDFVPTPTATIDNVVPTDVTTVGGSDGLITFDATIANFAGTGTASLTPTAGTTPITLADGANTGLTFTDLIADNYTITILDDTTSITTEANIMVNNPSTGGDLIPLTPEDDDSNPKTDGTIDGNYADYDIIISKNQHPDYIGNGLFIGKEIALNDLNQSGMIEENEALKLTFTSLTEYNTTLTGDYTGILYLKAFNIGLTPLITRGQYQNNDTFAWLEDITPYNMLIQKWWDAPRNDFTYTPFITALIPDINKFIYTGKNSAETAAVGWDKDALKIETGIGENSYLEIIYGFNFTSIDNIVISSTADTFTVSDFSDYDFLFFDNEFGGTGGYRGNWLIRVSDITQDGITKHAFTNYNIDNFTITGNVLTWTSVGSNIYGKIHLKDVYGIKI